MMVGEPKIEFGPRVPKTRMQAFTPFPDTGDRSPNRTEFSGASTQHTDLQC